MNNILGENIARLRKERGLTQEDLAKELNISYQAVSKWENGVSSPDISNIMQLARFFGVSIDMLFGMELTPQREDAPIEALDSAEEAPAETEAEPAAEEAPAETEAEPAAEQTAVRSAAASEEASVQRTASPRTHAAARSRVRQETNAGAAADTVRAATAMDRPVTAERGEIMFVGGGGQTVATDAEAVSRAIQRDARRYDGGFSLY